MVRVRKLVLAIAAASALSSGMAHALGLGEVTLQSALNQPLVAEIELLEVRDLATNEVLPNLASPDEFNKAGVDRQYFLTDLKFTPIIKANGKSVIRVTSSKPVREPYLNFLVEVLWPNGRLLREYTLLLDPPLYSPQTAAAAAPQLPMAAPVPRAPASAPVAPTASRAPVSAPAPAPSAAPVARSAAPGGEYRTTANDTLWEIAQRARGNGSVHQAMLAIQDLNPDAFIDGNINRMKSGQVLRLPEGEQITARTQNEALAQVAEQNAAWRERRAVGASARQLDATRRSAAGAAPAQAQTQDSLKLLAADSGDATRGSDTGAAGSKALSDKLAVTQESLDSTRRENDELKSRLGDLEGQLDKLQRLIQLKDDQLAKLQADLAQPGSTAEPAGEAEAPTAPAASAEAQPEVATPADSAAPQAEPQAQPDYNYAEPEAASPAPADAATLPATQAEPAEPAPAKPVAPAQPAAPVEPVAERGMLDDLFANPMLLGIGGGIALLALLIALMMVSRRNAMKEAEAHEERQLAGGDASPYDSDLELPADSFEGMSDDLGSEPSSEAPVTAQTGDALGEADIYIAYGRFNQAAELLQNAINDEPHRADLRLKLMEVHAELGDREGFARQENELREIGGAAADVDQLKARYPAMAVLGAGFAAAAVSQDDLDSFSLDDLTLDEPQSATTPTDLDDGFDLSLDDLSSDLDDDQPKSADDLDSLSLDSDLDLSVPSTPAAEADDLAFDLALDDEVQGDAALSDDLADFSLDLDSSTGDTSEEDDFLLSLDDEPAPAAPVEPTPSLLAEEDAFDLPSDFDLSLGDDEPAAPAADSFAAQLDSVTAELDQLSESLDASPADAPPPAVDYAAGLDADDDDDFDFLSGTDETATKLDLARAYIDMGDTEGARDILDEVVSEGDEGQQQEARELISKLV
ncbi:MAG: peptigoglycan-binding protein LysM [Gammaproteobacteria bacterium]|nr:peptigoglycan-binding protein LysM [Gammaproteobacteria bacterium]MBU1491348.1 peptigoglycan-binding protein LysM [Gammaproteobacteria bacterium]MBU2064623.1 peptigoglycan-binding protein LysM [Gammaproteobacteria bacterium]MBU2138621.1 peptigoglycan-binding protein LysM [Gammaproteobacteria bacterium]MBU2217066.1 peptigoglycan-binding protein LysM [Gammaproteobacteria bacterium]